MKYSCKFCDFHWEGTAGTFDAVRIHEKTHEEKKKKNPDQMFFKTKLPPELI